MKKTFKRIMLAMAFAVFMAAGTFSATIFADDGNGENHATVQSVTWNFNPSTGVLTIAGTGPMGNSYPWSQYAGQIKRIVINNGVTTIGSSAFSGFYGVTQVSIPESVTSIGTQAFYDCSGLTSLTIPSSVTSIGGQAFSCCKGLGIITVDSANTVYDSRNGCNAIIETATGVLLQGCNNTVIPSGVTSISAFAFYGCRNITSINIPSGVTSIGGYAFYFCTGLTSVEIPDSVMSIGTRAFAECIGMTNLTIGNGVTTIGSEAFRNCNKLSNLTMPAGASYDCTSTAGSFRLCTGITSVSIAGIGEMRNYDSSTYQYTPWCISRANNPSITIEDGVTTIGNYAFRNCSGLTSIEISDSVESIGSYAFSGCSGLTSIEIPNSVESIGESAFSYCSGLTSIEIPGSVESIGSYAFSGCNGLNSITVDSANTVYDSRNNSNAIIETSTNMLILGCKNTEIPNSVESIGNAAFFGCSGLTSIEIPDSVKDISIMAFAECTGMTNLTIGNGVTGISEEAFRNCKKLSDLTMPAGTSYQCTSSSGTFLGCTGITSVTLTGNGPMINYSTDYRDGTYHYTPWYISRANNPSITIEDGVTTIGNNAFHDCNGLASIEIPDSVESIGDYAFYYCSGLQSIEIPGSVESIGDYAFYGCSGLTGSLEIPGSVKSIGDYAFHGCSGFNSITVDSANTVYDSRNNCNAIIETSTNKLILGCKNTEIPDGVESIGDNAFYGCSGLTGSLEIPSGVTSIGSSAFYGCIGLTSIEIPDSVESIGYGAFYDCSGLTDVTLGTSVENIGSGAFYNCIGLTSIEIPNSVTSIGSSAFYRCRGITSLTMPAGAEYYCTSSNGTFEGCTGITSVTLTGNGPMIDYSADYGNTTYKYTPWYISRENSLTVIIEEGVTSIGKYAFHNCSGLTSLTMPAGATYIYKNSGIIYGAFGGCTGITSVTLTGNGDMNDYDSITYQYTPWYISRNNSISVTIEDGIWSIGDYAFYDCSGLQSIEVPNSVTSIESYAFYGCRGISSIEIPESVMSIGNFAFYGCSGLQSIEIPRYVTSIGGSSFYGCTGLTEVIIGTSVGNIGDSAFYGCSGLTSIEIPDSVKWIGNYAFQSCSNLTDLTMPAVSTYDSNTFSGCTGITSVTLTGNGPMMNFSTDSTQSNYYQYTPWYISRANNLTITMEYGVTSIGNFAFSGCSGLQSVEIPMGVTSIGNNAFCYCSGLTSIEIPDSVESIGDHAFSNCSGLQSVEIPVGVTGIGKSVFYYCSGLQSVEIPVGVTSIGNSAFSGCSGLASIEIPSSVKSIGNRAFSGCSGLNDIEVLPGNKMFDSRNSCNAIIETSTNKLLFGCKNTVIPLDVSSIGDYAFENCIGLTSIEIPVGVTTIGNYAFFYCSGLTSIEIPAGVNAIGYDAFNNCSGLKDVYYGGSSSDRQGINIGSNNSSLLNATWHYTPCEHNSTHHASVAATCTEAGNIEYWYCALCKKYFSDEACTTEITQAQTVIAAKGHTKEHHPAKAATCTESGNTEYWYCTACKKYFSDEACTAEITQAQTVIEAKGHKEEHYAAVPATCTETGNIEYWYCPGCKKYFIDGACATEITQAQTVIAAKGHTKEHHAAVAATCTESGNIEYWYCTTCKRYFSDEACTTEITQAQTVVEAKGHTKEHHAVVAPTYTAPGNIEYWYCTACKKYFSDEACTTEITQAQTVIPKKEVPSIEGKFSDVSKEDWFYDSVAFVNATGIMTGMGGTNNFAPYAPLQREQLAVMLYRLEKSPATEYSDIFPDVPEGTWYTLPIIWAYRNGIITGYQSGYFGVGDNITREQLAVMLYRYAANYKHLDVSTKADISGFLDAASVSDWAYDAISWAVGNGIISGKDGGTRIDPQGNAARCECAAMFQRFMNRYGL